jgi:predicted anti-sigma-YlaC factor YlaD
LFARNRRHADEDKMARQMRCEEVGEALAPYLAGALKGWEEEAIERHLRSCEGCRTLLAQEIGLNRVMRQGLRLEVDPGYWERIWPRVQTALVQRRQRRPRLWLRWALAGAGALATAAAVSLFVLARSFFAPVLTTHDASYFTDLPTAPPAILEEDSERRILLELANLSLGQPTPSERAAAWRRMEGF